MFCSDVTGWGKNGQRWSQTVKSSLFESQRALSVLAFLGEIRVLVGFWAGLFTYVWESPQGGERMDNDGAKQ